MENENTSERKRESKNVARSTALMSACTLVSRATGFIRTWAMAFALGNTVLAAGFSLANNLPNMIYELVAGGVLSTAFLPIYLQLRNQKGLEARDNYASNLLSITVVVLGVIALLASIFAPQVMVTQSLFGSADEEAVSDAVWFFRFLAFEIIFYGISAVFSGILNAEREFFWPAISSVFMNIIAIIGFFGYPFVRELDEGAGITWLGVTMLLSIAVMAFVQLPAIRRTGIKLRFVIELKGEGFRETLKLALPAIACTAINLVSLSVMNSCALHVVGNGPAVISYAWMWYQFPYGVLGVALSTAMFTELSEDFTRGDRAQFRMHMLSGLRLTWLLIIPMAAMLFSCSYELVGLYASGKFTAEGIFPVSNLLKGWAMALPLYAGYMFVYRVFSALKDMKTVAICNAFLTVIQVSLYALFTGVIESPIQALGTEGFGLLGLAMGDFCFYALMLATLLGILAKRMKGLDLKSLVAPVLKVSAASLVGAGVSIAVSSAIGDVLPITNTLFSLVNVVCAGGSGLVVICLICHVLHVDEITRMLGAVKRRVVRK